MKKFYILFMFLCCISSAFSQETKKYTLEFTKEDFSFSVADGVCAITSLTDSSKKQLKRILNK